MSGGHNPGARALDKTPTWAVALVCAIIVLISILLEKMLHAVSEFFRERRKKPMLEALEKIKAELMILGFISLLLTFGQNYIANICISTSLANTMLPCKLPSETHESHNGNGHNGKGHNEESEHHRRLLWNEHRFLSADSSAKGCKTLGNGDANGMSQYYHFAFAKDLCDHLHRGMVEGHVPLISAEGLHQLHIFIFFLAVFHVIYSAMTMMLGRLKIRGWKEWERETIDDDGFNDPTRFRLTKETSFVKEHTSFWTKSPVFFYFVCFFRQFLRSVRKADYLAMRHGFISVHLAPGSKFDFQKYIKRSLEDDFKVVVGISPLLWASAVLYLFLNVDGWQSMFCLSFMPLVVILAVGTKLQAIITQMAVEIQERHAVVQGMPLVQVSDRHFWFGWPQLILYLIHLTLFQNAFEITFFFWIWYEFGLKSCFHQNFTLIIVRVALGVGVQILCSYITLPLYALVTQMGSNMKKSIFDEQTSKALMNWHKNAMKKKNEGKPGAGATATRTLGGSPGDSPDNSPGGNTRVHIPQNNDEGLELGKHDLL